MTKKIRPKIKGKRSCSWIYGGNLLDTYDEDNIKLANVVSRQADFNTDEVLRAVNVSLFFFGSIPSINC